MTIGIIGGAGVAATNKLLDMIEKELTMNGAFRDCHHPEMVIIQATKAPSRSMYLEGRGESFIEDYVDVAIKLRLAGADLICMSCNTAHYAIDEISRKSNVNFINLVNEVVLETGKRNVSKVGLIATDGCLKGKVYEKYFAKYYPDIELLYPDDEYQKLVTKGICNIKNKHRFDDINSSERPNYIFRQVKEHLKSKGAQIVVMGCTDIRVDYFDEDCIDSLEILKNSILREVY